ncbi:MAG: DNA polymerase III subunit beta [Anaerolineaceae bacterium]|nr:DNA polymerase III subunit beta [Anaerolineaceae bacterium]
MRVSLLQQNLARGLSIVARAVESRPSLPVLQNVLLRCEDASLQLVATDLRLTISYAVGAKIDEAGEMTLPARTLVDFVNQLAPERVDLSLDREKQQMNIRCGGAVSNIKGVDAQEFPLVPEAAPVRFHIAARELKQMIRQTTFAAAAEDTRPILTGVYTSLEGNVLTMAAADGYRLAVRTAQLDAVEMPAQSTNGAGHEMVIPARALRELERILVDDDELIGVSLPDERMLVTFHSKDLQLSSQLLDGKFPDFAAIIPDDYSTCTVLDREDLLRACRRSEIFARDSAHSTTLVVQPAEEEGAAGSIVTRGRSSERGDFEGSLPANVDGETLEISFNVRYLIDVLNILDSEQVRFESSGPSNPGVIRPASTSEGETDDGAGDRFIHVIMPMSVSGR